MKPYYQSDGITLYYGDCREVLPNLKHRGAVVVADPPYGQTSLKWDRWQGDFLTCIPADICSLWCFGTMRMFMDHATDFKAGEWKLSQDLVWEKHNGSSFHADRFRRVHESVCYFYRGPWDSTTHETPTTPDAVARAVRRKKRPTHMGHIEASSYVSQDGGPRLMRSVMFYRSMHGCAIHPTQKPVGLVKPLIAYSRPTLVISPYCGSGTDLIAARELGIPAIGIEAEEKFCEATVKRLEQEYIFS